MVLSCAILRACSEQFKSSAVVFGLKFGAHHSTEYFRWHSVPGSSFISRFRIKYKFTMKFTYYQEKEFQNKKNLNMMIPAPHQIFAQLGHKFPLYACLSVYKVDCYCLKIYIVTCTSLCYKCTSPTKFDIS